MLHGISYVSSLWIVLSVRAYPQQNIVQWLVQLARQRLKESLLSDEIARVIEVVLHDQFVLEHESDASGTGFDFAPGLECRLVLEDAFAARAGSISETFSCATSNR
jgi:hypothetical protein